MDYTGKKHKKFCSKECMSKHKKQLYAKQREDRLATAIASAPKCKLCDNKVHVRLDSGSTVIVNEYCSRTCANKDKWNGKAADKRSKTNLERYGHTNPGANADIIQQRAETMLSRYGVAHPSNSPELMQKKRDNNLEKYGVEWVTQTESYKSSARRTLFRNHGVWVPFHSPELLRKSQDTLEAKYGVRNPVHHPDLLDKLQRSMHMFKNYTLPSGKVIELQGYEDRAMDILLESYSEHDILWAKRDMPKIHYYLNGKRHRYYPDFYIPKDNVLIEVKSDWTYNNDKAKNLAKQIGVLETSYEYLLMIL